MDDHAPVIADDVDIAATAVLHPGVVVESGVRIQDHAVLGKPPLRAPLTRSEQPEIAETRIGAGAQIGSGAVICRGATVGERALIGDHVLLREMCVIGDEVLLSHCVSVGYQTTIGARCAIRNNVVITPLTTIEDDVFIGPNAAFSDMNYMDMRRSDHSIPLECPVLRRGCQIGTGAVLLPGVEIGEKAIVAAGSVVSKSVEPGTLVMGVPARPRP